MKKKGFTLIELLAVIVILGIIAVITVPIIGGILENSKEGAFKASSLSIFDAYLNYEAEHGFQAPGKLNLSDLSLSNSSYFVSGTVDMKEDDIYIDGATNGVFCASGTKGDLRVVKGNCELLDLTPPKILGVTTEVTTNSIKIFTTYEEVESFISKHEYRIIKENEDIENVTWVSGDTLTENLSTKIFTNLEQGEKYKIQLKFTNFGF